MRPAVGGMRGAEDQAVTFQRREHLVGGLAGAPDQAGQLGHRDARGLPHDHQGRELRHGEPEFLQLGPDRRPHAEPGVAHHEAQHPTVTLLAHRTTSGFMIDRYFTSLPR